MSDLPKVDDSPAGTDDKEELANAVVQNSEDPQGLAVIAANTADPSVSKLSAETRSDALTAVAINYVALQQKVSETAALRKQVERLTSALESIPLWHIDPDAGWSSDSLRRTMLHTGLDKLITATGGFGFFLLHGDADGLRTQEEATRLRQLYYFSASAQDHFLAMRRQTSPDRWRPKDAPDPEDVCPRLSDTHTPLFRTTVNTGTPTVISGQTLRALTLQGRALFPKHHFPMSRVCLLPFGRSESGILVGLASGTYPEAVVEEVSKVLKRFFDGVRTAHKRMVEAEARVVAERHAQMRHTLAEELQRTFGAIRRAISPPAVQVRETLEVLARRFSAHVAYQAMSFPDAVAHLDSGVNGAASSTGGRSAVSVERRDHSGTPSKRTAHRVSAPRTMHQQVDVDGDDRTSRNPDSAGGC
eukprot:TRINITY_DN1605_c0_g1_i3.p1 TRINITY_DN1605_c0_g1~~TRINITY_DN1605_c0_g1_i3.p1  ORF type:complete len:417 (+),score=110.98 TRINITY_DN1605_c0_g1_i3:87-1337(+)